MLKEIVMAAALLVPVTLLAQKTDTLRTGFLDTVVISSYNHPADLYGYRYDGQARTERLLEHIPGIDVIGRGNFAQEPVLRGMSDGQINVTINGLRIYGACTDRMDPVTSYIEPNNMRSLQVCSGPSFGSCGAAIGGGLNVDFRQAQPDSAKKLSGSIGTGFETNAAARQILGNIQYSNKRFAFSLDGIYRKAGDYTPGGDSGKIKFSQYEKWNGHANAAYTLSPHQTINADYLQDEANNVGYPALTMDVRSARSKMAGVTHEYQNMDKTLYYWQSRIYYSDIDHVMDNSKRPIDEIPIKAKLETYINRWHSDMIMGMAGDTMNTPMYSRQGRPRVHLYREIEQHPAVVQRLRGTQLSARSGFCDRPQIGARRA